MYPSLGIEDPAPPPPPSPFLLLGPLGQRPPASVAHLLPYLGGRTATNKHAENKSQLNRALTQTAAPLDKRNPGSCHAICFCMYARVTYKPWPWPQQYEGESIPSHYNNWRLMSLARGVFTRRVCVRQTELSTCPPAPPNQTHERADVSGC